MEVFEHSDYKRFVRARIKAMPAGGRGQFRKIAEALRMHSTLVSQVFNGERELTPEQACDLADFWGLNALESEMLVLLVQIARAGSKNLKRMLEAQAEALRAKSRKFAHRLPKFQKLTPEAQSVFYSSWMYSAIRLGTSIDELKTVDQLAAHFHLSRAQTARVLEFLTAQGLCVGKNGSYAMGPQRTHLDGDSAFVARHHLNWRLKSIEQLGEARGEDLRFTAPLSISRQDFKKVRQQLLKLVDDIAATVAKSPAEEVACINIDWFGI